MSEPATGAAPYALRFPPTRAGFEEGARALGALLRDRALETDARFQVELVFEEIADNIVRHGSATGEVDVTVAFVGDEVVLTFQDDGAAFDLRERPDPPVPDSLDEARVGGLGLVLVRKVARSVEYERTRDDRNRLTLVIPAR